MNVDSPILVTGPGRSGTTFMQWFLSSHPKIEIFGQPYVKLSEWGDLIAKLDAANAEVKKVNEEHPIFKKYEYPHHAGGAPGTFERELAALVRAHYGGYSVARKPYWGLKAVWASSYDEYMVPVARLFPKAKWVTCIRDPFRTIESIKSTFGKDCDVPDFFTRWAKAVELAVALGSPLVKIEELAKSNFNVRKICLDAVLRYLGHEATESTDAFIQTWPDVHRDVGPRSGWKLSEDGRKQQLEENHRFVCAMKLAGYEV